MQTMRAIDNYTPEQIDMLKLKGMLSDTGTPTLHHENCEACERAAKEQLKGMTADHSPTCKGTPHYYDGALGYEAMRCDVCGYELDLNAEANAKATAERLAQRDTAQPFFASAHQIAEWKRKAAHAERLAEALTALFRECAMVHKYWGENCNQVAADAAVTKANSALHAWEITQ
jgi:hypothetical protein